MNFFQKLFNKKPHYKVESLHSFLERVIVVDCETSGVKFGTHGLLSIGAVRLTDLNETFYGECGLDEGREISPQALLINGFTTGEITDKKKQTAKSLVKSFYAWAEKYRKGPELLMFCGHNPGFDVAFIKEQVNSWPFMHRSLDLHTVAFTFLGKSLSHAEICDALGLEREPTIHNGLHGAVSEAVCMRKLLGFK